TQSPDAPMTRRPGSLLLRVSPLALRCLRSSLLNAVHEESGVTPLWAILDAANEHERRAVLIAAIDGAFAAAELLGLKIVADEGLVADDNSLGVKLPAARIKPLFGIHCVTLRYSGDSLSRARDEVCRRTSCPGHPDFLSGSAVATQPAI